MQKKHLSIPLGFLLTGFISAYFVFGYNKENAPPSDSIAAPFSDDTPVANPFIVKDDAAQNIDRVMSLENELVIVKQQLQKINETLLVLAKSSDTKKDLSQHESTHQPKNKNRYASALTQRLYNLDNLIRGGIDPSLAEDIVRRKNSIELQRLALQDRATREAYLNTKRYYDELAEINKQDVSLRKELGDERYDEYLFNSKQNNRIRISSVMLGSAAEQAGIQKGDIILSYNNNRLFTWQELKDATAEGRLGEYVSISVYRNGAIFSFSVPRGPLGMQLGATRLQP